MDSVLIQEITRRVVNSLRENEKYTLPVGVSTRHVHLSERDSDYLFGSGHRLQPMKKLQAGEFAAEETLTVVGGKMRALYQVRVLGPFRKQTQVEVSRTDAIYLGVKAPWRSSGDLKESGEITLVGPKGSIRLAEGAIVAKRHIHLPTPVAREWGLSDHQEVAVEAVSERPVILKGVEIRVADNVDLQIHLDTDDANAAGLNNHSRVRILTGGGICG